MEATVTPKRDRKSNFNKVEIEVMLEMLFKYSDYHIKIIAYYHTTYEKPHAKIRNVNKSCIIGDVRSRMTVR